MVIAEANPIAYLFDGMEKGTFAEVLDKGNDVCRDGVLLDVARIVDGAQIGVFVDGDGVGIIAIWVAAGVITVRRTIPVRNVMAAESKEDIFDFVIFENVVFQFLNFHGAPPISFRPTRRVPARC